MEYNIIKNYININLNKYIHVIMVNYNILKDYVKNLDIIN